MISAGFSTTNLPISRLIRFFTKSKVSHCFVILDLPELDEQPMVLEAAFEGIRLVPLETFKKKNIIVETVSLPQVTLSMLKPMFKQLGSSYDFGGLLGSTFVQIGHWIKKKWKNPFNSSHALFCSEATVVILQDSNYPNSQSLVPSETSPQDLLNFLHKGA